MKNCKNFWKRGISLALALMMCLTLLPVNVFAAPAETHVHTTLAADPETCEHLKTNKTFDSYGILVTWYRETCKACGQSRWVAKGWITGNWYKGNWGSDQKPDVDEKCEHKNTEVRDAVTATCTKAGYTGDTYCKDCNTKIATGHKTAVDPNNHDGETEVRGAVTATCKDGGKTGDTYCLGCGEKISDSTDTQKDPDNHAGGTEVRDAVTATCTEAGYTGDTYCLGCDTKIADGEEIAIDADAHDWDNGEVTTKPTCTEKGVKTFTCTRDASHTRTEEIAIDETAHDWGDWVKDGDIFKRTCKRDANHTETWDPAQHEGQAPDHTCDSSVDVAEVPATCTKEGTTAGKKCSICGEVQEGCETIPMAAHSYGEWETVTAATCVAKGTEKHVCTECGHEETRDIPVNPNAHNWSTEWTSNANKHYHVCTNPGCNAKNSSANHKFKITGAVWTGGSFTEKPKVDLTFKCETCGCETAKTNDWGAFYADTKKATICGEEDERVWIWRNGTVNGVKVYDEVWSKPFKSGNPLPHIWGDWTIISEPTATTAGAARRRCERSGCTEVETKVLPALTDSTVWTLASSKVATCMENGQEVYTSEYGPVTVTIEKDPNNHDAACTVGGWVQSETQHWHVRTCGAIVDTADHTWTNVKYVDGKYSYECETCGYQVTGADEAPASHEHKFTTSDPGRDAYCAHVSFTQHWGCSCGLGWDEVNEGGIKSLDAVRTAPVTATCIADGNIEYWTCQDCGKHFSDAACTVEVSDVITTDPDNHAYGDWTITTAPTATTDGLATRVCGNDETHIDTKVLPALNDLPAAEGWTKDNSQHVDAGCETAGQDVYVNTELGLELTVVIPKLGHAWGDWNVTTAPTADAEGAAKRTCGRCGDTETKTLPALGGNGGEGTGSEWTYAVTVEPGCTTDGVGTYTYTDGTSLTVTIPATGHAWGDWTVALEPTYAAEGLEIRTCANCGETQTRVISALELPEGGLGGDTEEPEIEIEDEQTPLAGMPYALNPEDLLTRGHLMYVLHWFDGEPEAEISTFIDVAFEAYYSVAIGWAQDENIARGTPDNKFMPEDTVTRGQMEVFLTRYAEYLGLDMEVVLVGDDSDLMFWAEAETILNEFFASLPVEA